MHVQNHKIKISVDNYYFTLPVKHLMIQIDFFQLVHQINMPNNI